MRRQGRTLAQLGLGLLLAACGGGAAAHAADGQRAVPSRRDMLTVDEFGKQQWANAYDLIAALRPNWLHQRGPDTVNGQQVELRVHLNGMPYGGAESLRGITVLNVKVIRYYDPITASGRWGLDYRGGAVDILTSG